MNIIGKPKITKCSSKPLTRVSFKPDYARFGIEGLTPDLLNLLRKRVYDISAVTDNSSLKVGKYTPGTHIKIYKDSFVYIPKNVEHGLKNTGEKDLELLWIFPTDCWEEVEYIFEK